MAAKLLLNEGIALITGAASGIGKETALSLAEAGVQGIVFADLNAEGVWGAALESKSLARHPDYRAVPIQIDVSDSKSVDMMVRTAVREFGRIDYFVHCAGIPNLSTASTPDLDIRAFDRLHEINTRGTLLCIRAVSHIMAGQKPRMYPGSRRHAARSLGRGSIVILGSVNSYSAAPGLMSYVAGKHAVLGMVRCAALDTLKHSIRINAVCPGGPIASLAPASSKPSTGLKPSASSKETNSHASPHLACKPCIELSPRGSSSGGGRAATPEEVADYCVFLCSPSATYINGTGLCLDGGEGLGERNREGGEGLW